MKLTLFIAIFSLLTLAESYAQTAAKTSDWSAEAEEKALLLLKVSGTHAGPLSVIDQIVEAETLTMKNKLPPPNAEALAKYLELFRAELNNHLPELRSLLTEIYLNELSQQEIQELIEFYQTPLGKKYAMSNRALNEQQLDILEEWKVDMLIRTEHGMRKIAKEKNIKLW